MSGAKHGLSTHRLRVTDLNAAEHSLFLTELVSSIADFGSNDPCQRSDKKCEGGEAGSPATADRMN